MFSQRMLAQLVSHSGGTPQVLSSTPCGSEFQAEGKKKTLAGPVCQSTGCETTQVGLRTLTWPRQVVPRGYVSQCQGGARVRGFSRSGKPSLLLDNTGGAVFLHPAEFFLLLPANTREKAVAAKSNRKKRRAERHTCMPVKGGEKRETHMNGRYREIGKHRGALFLIVPPACFILAACQLALRGR